MDERRTVSILAWAVGSVVGTMFLLNAVALSFVAAPPSAAKEVAARNVPALQSPAASGTRGG
jgi:hypothetical protein